jgi:hypothetical protein
MQFVFICVVMRKFTDLLHCFFFFFFVGGGGGGGFACFCCFFFFFFFFFFYNPSFLPTTTRWNHHHHHHLLFWISSSNLASHPRTHRINLPDISNSSSLLRSSITSPTVRYFLRNHDQLLPLLYLIRPLHLTNCAAELAITRFVHLSNV